MPKTRIIIDEQEETFDFSLRGKDYSIPLLPYMTLDEVAEIQENEGKDFLKKYIPDDVIQTLKVKEIQKIVKGWRAASEEDPETMGE